MMSSLCLCKSVGNWAHDSSVDCMGPVETTGMQHHTERNKIIMSSGHSPMPLPHTAVPASKPRERLACIHHQGKPRAISASL